MPISHEPVTLAHIQQASKRIGDRVVTTPLLYAPRLSELCQREVYLKCENLQRTGAFKLRGALNKVLSIAEHGGAMTGVITASSGNHGQAVAYAAALVGLPCTVVVPENVLAIKEQAILGYGAQVIRCGTTSSERIELAERIAAEKNLKFVPPYDDPFIVAGQGTVGLEIAEQLPDAAAVIVPVGGGGLLSGVATAIKSLLPNAAVYGAEPALANDTYLSRQQGRPVDIGATSTIADGLRTSHPGEFTFPIVQKYVDDIVLVSEEEIKAALTTLLETSKLLVEPSGCTSAAAALKLPELKPNEDQGPVVCVLSGGNVELSTVAELILGR